jgi:hypothetical protein
MVMLATQQAAQLKAGRNPLLFLRTEFWHDQLGYLAISADVANGHFDLTEPVTMTGVNHYPRLYYSLVGLVARTLGLPTVTTWNLVSFALQFAAAFTVGMVAAHLSRRWWVGLLAPVPFLTGVFAYLSGAGAWYTVLQAHAVLWGPFGVLFSNNAETAGVCVGIIVLGCLVWAWNAPIPRAARNTITIVGAAAVGALSSFQTYSFLTMTYLLAFGAATAGVYLARRRAVALGVSLALVAVVVLVGPVLAERVGQLPTLIFGVLPALPGLFLAIVRSRGIVAYAGVAAVAAASPQVLYTLTGMLQGDPFLTYRVASNNQLGIVSWQALTGASVVLVALIAAFVMGLKVKDALSVVLSGAGLTALPLLAVNDVWGANAEPYRFWIEGILLGGVLSMFALARLCGLILIPSAQRTSAGEARPTPASVRKVRAGILIVVGLLWTASLPDWVNSLRDGSMQAVWNPSTPRETAISELARAATADPASGLLTTELCIDNRTAKVTSGSPISNYHLGMAWPAEREAIDGIRDARDAGELDFAAMSKSGTRWVLTDSNCASAWERTYSAELTSVASQDYVLTEGEVISAGSQGSGTITLWEIRDQR